MNERPKIAAFDFDATIVEYGTMEPLPGMLPLLRKLIAEGWKVIIHTSRRDKAAVRVFLREKGIRTRVYYKPDARVYVDDRALRCDGGSSENLYRQIVDFMPWYVRRQIAEDAHMVDFDARDS